MWRISSLSCSKNTLKVVDFDNGLDKKPINVSTTHGNTTYPPAMYSYRTVKAFKVTLMLNLLKPSS